MALRFVPLMALLCSFVPLMALLCRFVSLMALQRWLLRFRDLSGRFFSGQAWETGSWGPWDGDMADELNEAGRE